MTASLLITLCALVLQSCLPAGPVTVPPDSTSSSSPASSSDASRSPTTSSAASTSGISDADLLAHARSDYDKQEKIFTEETIGTHNGMPVKVEYPCGDVCPEYTIRIIHYDVPVEQCSDVGGEVKEVLVPVAIAVMKKPFCFPKVLVEEGLV